MSIENGILVWKLSPQNSELAISKYNLENPVNSLDEASKFLPGGAYTTLRTYSRTKVMRIADHFLRLKESAQRVNPEFHPKVALLRQPLKQILHASPFAEARLRVTLDLENEPGCFYATLEELQTPPAQAYEEGVSVISHRMQRDNPKAKLTNFLITAAEYRSQLPQGVNEMLMVDQNGILLEGLSSNFYGVKGGAIWTVEEGVLPGITRGAVLEIAEQNQFPVNFEGIKIFEIESLEECFITSASRGVLPVVQIDETVIGSGEPGKLSRQLMQLFTHWVERTIEEI